MTPLETSGSTIARFGHPHTDEAEEHDLKNNFMKMIEALKEEMKNSLKEIEKETNKIWKKSRRKPRKTINM